MLCSKFDLLQRYRILIICFVHHPFLIQEKNYSFFTESFDEAVKIYNHRRTVPPGLYNIRRMNETPIPTLNQNSSNHFETQSEESIDLENDLLDTDLSERSDEVMSAGMADDQPEQSIEEVLVRTELLVGPIDKYSENDPLSHCDPSSTCNRDVETNQDTIGIGSTVQMSETGITTDSGESIDQELGQEQACTPSQATINTLQDVTMIPNVVPTYLATNSLSISSVAESSAAKSEPVPLYEACSSNDIELQDILDDTEVIDKYDEEVTFIINRKTGYAKPLKTDSNGLVKRENDIVTGDVPYNDTVSFIFLYILNDSK